MIVNLTSQFSNSVGTPLFYKVQQQTTLSPALPGKSKLMLSYLQPNLSFRPALGQPIIVTTVVSGSGGGSLNSTFIFRGFYAAGNLYETWQGTSRNTPPPSGHSLIDITVVGELQYNGIF